MKFDNGSTDTVVLLEAGMPTIGKRVEKYVISSRYAWFAIIP